MNKYENDIQTIATYISQNAKEYDHDVVIALNDIKQLVQETKWHHYPEEKPTENGWYQCVLENNEDRLPAFCEWSEESEAFGFNRNIFDEVTYGYVDTVFETMEELEYENVIAWKEIQFYEEEQ